LHDGQAADGEYDQARLCPQRRGPAQRPQPQRNSGNGEPEQDPEESFSHDLKRKTDGRRKVKGDVDRIGESLVSWISGAGRVKGTTVVALLNLASHVGAVGIASVQEQFSGAYPVKIEVGKIAARTAVGSGI